MIATDTITARGQTSNGSSDHHVSGGDSLIWRTPGNDRNIGFAAAYDIRCSVSPITLMIFASADKAVSIFRPMIAGSTQEYFAGRLTPYQVHYYAIKAMDTAGNWLAMIKVPAILPQIHNAGLINSDTGFEETAQHLNTQNPHDLSTRRT